MGAGRRRSAARASVRAAGVQPPPDLRPLRLAAPAPLVRPGGLTSAGRAEGELDPSRRPVREVGRVGGGVARRWRGGVWGFAGWRLAWGEGADPGAWNPRSGGIGEWDLGAGGRGVRGSGKSGGPVLRAHLPCDGPFNPPSPILPPWTRCRREGTSVLVFRTHPSLLGALARDVLGGAGSPLRSKGRPEGLGATRPLRHRTLGLPGA